jgi:hypothetical protein
MSNCPVSHGTGPRPGEHFEVSCLGGDHTDPNKRTVVGWTSKEDGGRLVAMVNKHPVWNSPEVRDLRKEKK